MLIHIVYANVIYFLYIFICQICFISSYGFLRSIAVNLAETFNRYRQDGIFLVPSWMLACALFVVKRVLEQVLAL
jgi:hypothetical protein